MKVEANGCVIELVQGDITDEETDAIVNAANTGLAGGSGVDGAIHNAGGPEIMAECRNIGNCPTGEAVITTGGRLKARRVIHTVGPIYRGGTHNEAALLASAYRKSLELALSERLKSVSFPSISTGAYGYPKKEAAEIALKTVLKFLAATPGSGLKLVRFVLFSDTDLKVYSETLAHLR
ncbi:MAG: O-acetyl-ADP-ribose deacetylase [Deltaproteobacteria bacterium]|nr:O-acetyl-ADP-ribose deacetylase [Deltaproteobacteria bacterium]